MATRTLETRFERLVVADENDGSEGGTTRLYTKGKVSDISCEAKEEIEEEEEGQST